MISFADAARATAATVFDADAAPTTIRVSTDTRSVEAGDTFLALRGEHFDGHDYTKAAVERGALALIVDDERARVPGVATLLVPDTLRAYLALAREARDRFAGRVVAITGSSGKTTTKYLLAQLLQERYGDRVAASPANENNEIGVSKFVLGNADDRHDVLVVEMGARHFGDIAPLVEAARPDIGILTNVGEAHVEIMGSFERVAQTKWQLFSGGAAAILNARDDESLRRAPALERAPHWFAAVDADGLSTGGRATVLLGRNVLVEGETGAETRREVDVRLPGAHNRANLAAAIAAARDLGVPLDDVVAAIPDLQLPQGRYESFTLASGARLIYDAYNANLSGMRAALDAFAQEASVRRIAVLASMAELGDEALGMHESVGEHAARSGVDIVLAGGSYAHALVAGAVRAGLSSERIVSFATNDEAADWLRENAGQGDVVLLKGSRIYRLEEIVERLRS